VAIDVHALKAGETGNCKDTEAVKMETATLYHGDPFNGFKPSGQNGIGMQHETVLLPPYLLETIWLNKNIISAQAGEELTVVAGGLTCAIIKMTSANSSKANQYLHEIRIGTEYEVGDVQNLATLIVDLMARVGIRLAKNCAGITGRRNFACSLQREK